MTGPKPGRDARIAVVGAGPAGLSAAWFLKANGYRNVTVLEKAGRIGWHGMSITENYQTYDIGANYVTMEYVETLRIAKTVGAKLYFEAPQSPEADKAAARLTAIGATVAPADAAQQTRRAERLYEAKLYALAAQAYVQIASLFPDVATSEVWMRASLASSISRLSRAREIPWS